MPETLVAFDADDLSIGAIYLDDAVVREGHALRAQPTEHPVEGSGQPRTDHIHQLPDVITLDCLVSNTPIHAPPTHADGAQETQVNIEVPKQVSIIPPQVENVIGTVSAGPLSPLLKRSATTKAAVRGFDTEFDRRRNVWNELRELKESGTLVTVVTTLQPYLDMVIVEVTSPVTVRNGNALEFQVLMQHIRLVESALTSRPDITSVQKSRPSANRGRKPTAPTPPEDTERVGALTRAIEGIGGLFG